MAISVESALQLEIFVRANARVVAGRSHQDRMVRWVHAAEIADIARFLSGGEMLLTAGHGIGRTEPEQRAFVRSLANSGVAVLVVEISGRVFSEVPRPVVEEADACGLPVVAIDETPFVEASAQVHGMIGDVRVRDLLAGEAANEAFTQLLLDGADYVAVINELSSRVDSLVVLEDFAHQILAVSDQHGPGHDMVEDWSGHSRLSHGSSSPGGPVLTTCARQPIALRGEQWGWLHVIHGERSLSPHATYAIGRAAAAVAIALLGERVSGARRSQRQAALMSRLMLGDVTGDEFVQSALKLGRDLRRRPLLAVVASDDRVNSSLAEPDLARMLSRAHAVCVASDADDGVIAVIGIPPRADADTVVSALAAAGVRAGVSRVVDASQLVRAIQQAKNAYAAAGTRTVKRFDELGVLRLLVVLAQGPELAQYVEEELGTLLQHDAGSLNPLLPSLRALLDCDGRKSDAAALLHVQRRTLYYRIDRLSALIGAPVDDPEVRQRLQLAVRGLDLLASKEAPRRGAAPVSH